MSNMDPMERFLNRNNVGLCAVVHQDPSFRYLVPFADRQAPFCSDKLRNYYSLSVMKPKHGEPIKAQF